MSKKRKSNFRGKTTKDAQRQKRAASSYGYLNLPKGINIYSPDPGSRVRLDILPYMVENEKHPDRDDEGEIATTGSLWYKLPFKTHRQVGVDNDVVVCPTSIGQKCPICEYRSKRMKEGADKDETDAMKSSLRNLYVVIPIRSKKYESEPHIWDISQWLFQNLLNEELEEDPDNGGFPDLEGEEQYTEEILEDVINLDEILVVLTYDELKNKLFYETEEEEDEDVDDYQEEEEEEEEPKKRTRKSTRKSKPKEEDEEEEEEEKEEKKPARRSHKGSSKKNKCPNEHKFGVDWDEYDDCADCDLYDECSEAADE